MSHGIKNIIFDYGGVIFDIDHQLTINAFKNLGILQMEEIFAHKGQSDLFDKFETGGISVQEFRNGLKKIINSEVSDQQIDDAWNAMLIGIPEGNLDLLKKVQSRYRSFLLSNNNEIHLNWILNYLPQQWKVNSMYSFFEKDYYSQLIGMRKPNEDIFEFVLETHDLKPDETLFIDDSPQHIRTAEKLGIKVRLVGKEEPLIQVLQPYLNN